MVLPTLLKHLLLTGVLFALLSLSTAFAQDKAYAEWYLLRDDVEIFVKELGTGTDTVIVVHGGFGANHDYLLDAVRGLEEDFHFVFYDQRGSLLSPVHKDNLTFQKNVDDLYGLTRALKLRNVKLLCHSMGTLVGMEFAEQHPDLVTHLVLTGALLPQSDGVQSLFSERHQQQVDFLQTRPEALSLMQQYKDKGVDTITVQNIDASGLTHKDLTEYWRLQFAVANVYDLTKRNLVKGGRIYYNEDATAMAETVDWTYDYRDVLNEEARTTVINGAFDFIDFSSETYQALIANYPNIQLHVLPEAAHNAWIDQPSIFRQLLVDGLRR